jgi:hypothetical protein
MPVVTGADNLSAPGQVMPKQNSPGLPAQSCETYGDSMKTFRWSIFSLVVLGALAAFAQTSSNVTVFSTGFSNPRGLKWGPDGNLYVAEGGIGGSTSTVGKCDQVVAPVGPYTGGANARISKVTPDGTRSTLVQALPSAEDAMGDILGVADVAFVGTQMYAVLAGGGCSHGHVSSPNAILKVNADGSYSRLADLSSFQALHPVASPNPGDFEPDGTWYSLISVGSNLYAVEPNHGEVDEITPDGIVTRLIDVSETQGHVVPTSIARIPTGFYVSNLNTFPITPGSSARYTVNNLGGVTKIVTGVTTVVGLVVIGNDTYFLELSTDAGFPEPGKGAVVRLRGAKFTTIASGLTAPTGMTVGADGALYVSNFGTGAPAGAGQIVKITLP